ncbi:MAG TPA: hypothetical protein VFJ43_12885 [Bacteroidia bacterium]|nr:hypothetical protein [Bacteroidia bacterium]
MRVDFPLGIEGPSTGGFYTTSHHAKSFATDPDSYREQRHSFLSVKINFTVHLEFCHENTKARRALDKNYLIFYFGIFQPTNVINNTTLFIDFESGRATDT